MLSEREIWNQVLPVMTFFVFAAGTAVGSFLNVVVWRLPRGKSLVFPGSHCPKCNHAIRPYENIPIISWLCLRARCSQCRQPISIRYPSVEFATGILFLAMWWRVWGSGVPLCTIFPYAYLSASLLAVALIDIEHFLIPNKVTFTGIAVAIAFAVFLPTTHLTQSYPGLPGGDQLILGHVVDVLSRTGFRESVRNGQVLAVLDVVTGALFGYGILWVILEAGKRLWGRRTVIGVPKLQLTITRESLNIDGVGTFSWDELLYRKRDVFSTMLCEGVFRFESEGAESTTRDVSSETSLRVRRGWIKIGEDEVPFARLVRFDGTASRCVLPREVMGRGDLKLMAMIGAFLGADSCILVLMLASIAGCFYGIVRIFTAARLRHAPIPFGPFLSGGAVLWILGGREFVSWYGRLLTGL